MAVVPPAFAAERGLQITPDGKRRLASKDVGAERWAITRNDDGTITGNVFSTDGSPPAFVACDPLGAPHAYECFGADACVDGSGAARGIQRTPDDKRVLASKDVGAERWAISLNDDGTVTGNVFRADGGEPTFLWCEPLGAPNAYRCSGADACNSEPCDALYDVIGDVTLPAGFFAVPEPCGAPFQALGEVTLPADFFELQQADDVVSSVATGDGAEGTLRIGVAPIPTGAPSRIADVSGDRNVVPGGTNQLQITFAGAAAAGGDAVQREAQAAAVLVVAVGDDGCAKEELVSDWFGIELDAVSGQLDLAVRFSSDLADGDFVLCLTTDEGGVVGDYFGLPQTAGPVGEGSGCVDVVVERPDTGSMPGLAEVEVEYPHESLSLPGSTTLDDPETPLADLSRVTFLVPLDSSSVWILDADEDGVGDRLFMIVSREAGLSPGDFVRISFDCVDGAPPPTADEFSCLFSGILCDVRVVSP